MKHLIAILFSVILPLQANAALLPPKIVATKLQPEGSFVQASVVARSPIITKKRKPLPPRVSQGYFYWGQCVWYVAGQRPVYWGGNADQWLPAAKRLGFATGKQPKVGAIYTSSESSVGHVALVTGVNAAKKTFTIKEMNYRGVGVVSTRTLPFGYPPLTGFIY